MMVDRLNHVLSMINLTTESYKLFMSMSNINMTWITGLVVTGFHCITAESIHHKIFSLCDSKLISICCDDIADILTSVEGVSLSD